MDTRKRDIVYQHWSRVIQYETRDLVSLELCSARALSDRDVRSDPGLESMLRAKIQERRSDLAQEIEVKRSQDVFAESGVDDPPVPSPSIPPASPEKVRAALDEFAQALGTALELGDEREAHEALAKIKALHTQNPGVIASTAVAGYEGEVHKLRVRLQQLQDQVAALAQRVVSASKHGHEEELAQFLRRLTAIQVAHPRVLDEAGLDKIRAAALQATDDRRQHQLTTKTLLERERAINVEIKRLASVVRDFHRVACKASDTSDEFQEAEAAYLRAIQKVGTYDTEWFTGVVLELADLLAEWAAPPPGAEGQINRFLDGISAGLKSIRAQMRVIENKQDSDETGENSSAAP